ncbi:MAG: glycosyltransferase family 4 protein [Bacteroidales bacterium]|nr:glycosyltransferase family 4 protein [Bacteroidales bacterium]
MKSMIINHRTQGKGVESVHLNGIAGGMTECGIRTHIVSPPGVDVSPNESKKGVVKNIARIAPQLFFECLELLHNLVAFSQLRKARKYLGCDMLYDRYAYLGIASAIAAKIWNVPLIVEVNYTSNSDLGVRSRSKLMFPLTRLFEYITFNSASLLLPVSTKLHDELIEHGYPVNKILVSPNAVDLSQFDVHRSQHETIRDDLFQGHREVVIGFVGSFAPWHRVDLLIEACIAVAGSTNMKLALMLVGEGKNQDKLEKMVVNLPANLDVVFTGFVPHVKLSEYISAMDIAVMPHSNDYGSPMKVFEYMAMEKAVVAPDLGPLRDAIDDGYDGILFSPGNVDKMKKALMKLINNPGERQKIGLRARKRVEDDHNWKNRCLRILNKLGIQQ